MTQEMYVRFNSTIQKKPAIYNLRRTMIIPHTIAKDATFYFNDNLFVSSEQPNRFGLAFVKSSAFRGSYRYERVRLSFLLLYNFSSTIVKTPMK